MILSTGVEYVVAGGRTWLRGGAYVVAGWGMRGCGGCAWLWGSCAVVGVMCGCGGCAWLGACMSRTPPQTDTTAMEYGQ